jgi:hypothetical protein
MIPYNFVTGQRKPASPSSMYNNRPGNYWQYLFLVAVAVGVAYTEVRPIGIQVSQVFQQLIDAFQNR